MKIIIKNEITMILKISLFKFDIFIIAEITEASILERLNVKFTIFCIFLTQNVVKLFIEKVKS